MRVITAFLHAIIFGVFCLLIAHPTLAGDKTQTNTLDGCICKVIEAEAMLEVVPWNKEREIWEYSGAKRFRYDNKTKISAENNLTVADVNAGQPIKTYHFMGVRQGKLVGKPFEIKELSGLVGRRTTLHWEEKTGIRHSVEISLPYLFAGESMAAMGGSDSSQVVGSDNCPCGSK